MVLNSLLEEYKSHKFIQASKVRMLSLAPKIKEKVLSTIYIVQSIRDDHAGKHAFEAMLVKNHLERCAVEPYERTVQIRAFRDRSIGGIAAKVNVSRCSQKRVEVYYLLMCHFSTDFTPYWTYLLAKYVQR